LFIFLQKITDKNSTLFSFKNPYAVTCCYNIKISGILIQYDDFELFYALLFITMQARQIFLIEDDVDDQEIFMAALEELDSKIDCEIAVNGYDGFTKLVNKQVHPDVIFLDLNMPLLNGHEFLKKIKQEDHLKNIPVIILTTSSNPNTIEEVKQLGAKDLITKPGSFSELTAILQKTLLTTL
jgi:CheY-like chemotaxis protein